LKKKRPTISIIIDIKMSYQILIKTLTGLSVPLMVDENETIESLKQKISEKENVSADQQRLVYCGKQLDDNQTLGYYEIKENSTIHLVLRLKGG
jgi:hypothetical protein